jgi:hypothetical protein
LVDGEMMGLLDIFFKKSEPREATSLDIAFILIGLYYGFYEKYGYEHKIEPETMTKFYVQSLEKANLTFNKLPPDEFLSVTNFIIQLSLDSGDFPSALKRYQKIPVNLESEEWNLAFKELLMTMRAKGFVSGLSYS